ncbi:LysE family translocator [Thioclava sp. GXIMD2076]|uniref:LysE family translocator n=1 Tax=Thioclava sp. GXIMD2076 TaxID=3131931 RepID=UPI0030D16F8C
MTLATLLTFALVTSLLVISPGPNGMLIARIVPLSGRRAGLAAVCGFVAAFYLHGTLSVLGISALLMQSAWAYSIFKLLGAGYLVWLGVRSLIAAARGATPSPHTPELRRTRKRRAFIEGFLTNALNPKVSLFYLAAFPQFLPVDHGLAQPFALVTLHATINALWFSAMVMALGGLRAATRRPAVQRALKAATGVVFIGFGLKLAQSRITP